VVVSPETASARGHRNKRRAVAGFLKTPNNAFDLAAVASVFNRTDRNSLTAFQSKRDAAESRASLAANRVA
jgi:hypothetical protein